MKQKKVGFLGMILGTLDANLIANMLAGKAKIPRRGVVWVGERKIRAGQDS